MSLKGKYPNGLRAAMDAAEMGPTELARAIETNKQNIIRWRDGERELPKPMAAKIAPVLKVAVEDLVFTPEERTPRLRLVSSFDPDEPDQGPREPRMIESTMGRDVGGAPKDAILEVDLRLGMGGGGVPHVTDFFAPDGNFYAAEGVRDWFRLPDHVVQGLFRVPASRIRCFEAVSDSMEPTVHDGDIVFVDVSHRQPSPPGIYALADALGGVILKRLEITSGRGEDPLQVRIISDNPKHTPESRTIDEIAIVGRYLGRLTKQ